MIDKFMKIGYGPQGATVQSPPSFLSNKEIMRRTVLRGKPAVSFSDLSLRKVEVQPDGKKKDWHAKGELGTGGRGTLQKYPTGKLSGKGTNQAAYASAPFRKQRPRISFTTCPWTFARLACECFPRSSSLESQRRSERRTRMRSQMTPFESPNARSCHSPREVLYQQTRCVSGQKKLGLGGCCSY